MSHRKFERPRHGSLSFLPKKRAKSIKPSIKAHPKDDQSKPCHITSFAVFKAGMSHVVTSKTYRDKNNAERLQEFVEPVTFLEAPPMVVFGIVGYQNTPNGLKRTKYILANYLSEAVLRRLYKKYSDPLYKEEKENFNPSNTGYTDEDLEELREKSEIIRILAHTQPSKISSLKTKKASILEIQVNGGSVTEKIEWALERLEKEIMIEEAFQTNEFIDVLGVTKGKGFKGVVSRWHVPKLPRKTNKGVRKVGCIGAWHPARVCYTVARAGQQGFHRRTQKNALIYKIGMGADQISTDHDLTLKTINPMGGFPHYGLIKNSYIMVKGSTVGPKKRILVIRKALAPNMKKLRSPVVKYIDTSSQMGKGRFQTSSEKKSKYKALEEVTAMKENN